MTRAWVIVALLLAPALAQAEPTTDPAARVVDYLARTQRADGSFGSSGYVLEGIAGLPIDATSWPSREKSLYAALEPFAGLANDPFGPYKGKVRLAYQLATAGYDPRLWKEDLVATIWSGYLGGQFGDPRTINDDTFALMALRAAGESVDDRMQASADKILAARNADGGWSIDPNGLGKSDVEDTAYALAALRAAKIVSGGDPQAKAFLDSTRVEDGGFSPMPGRSASCQSTAWGIQAMTMLGSYDAASDLAFLLKLQQPDGGLSLGSGASAAWCSAEALVVLSNDFAPRATFAPCPVDGTGGRALAPTTLAVPHRFGDSAWDIGGAWFDGSTPAFTPERRGEYPFFVLAEGSGARCRASGTLVVRSALPIAAAPTRIEALRNVPIEIDLSNSFDPDGVIVATRTTLPPNQTFALPGNYSVSASVLDDAGEWSLPTTILVHVANRAPVLANLPTRVTGDRAHNVTFAPTAYDADGDSVAIEGPRSIRFNALGNHTVTFVARDGYDGLTTSEVVVHVANIPPVLSNLTTESVDASDPDGPPPTVEWFVDGAPRSAAPLAVGNHSLRVLATDADNATTTLFANVTIRAEEAPAIRVEAPQEESPVEHAVLPISEVEFEFAPANVLVGSLVDVAVRRVEGAAFYRFDFGDGNATAWGLGTAETHAWSRPGAYELQAHARSDDGQTTMTTRIVNVREKPAPQAPDVQPLETTANADAATPEETSLPQPAPAESQPQEGRREAPGLGFVALLVCAALGTLARRASTRKRK